MNLSLCRSRKSVLRYISHATADIRSNRYEQMLRMDHSAFACQAMLADFKSLKVERYRVLSTYSRGGHTA